MAVSFRVSTWWKTTLQVGLLMIVPSIHTTRWSFEVQNLGWIVQSDECTSTMEHVIDEAVAMEHGSFKDVNLSIEK